MFIHNMDNVIELVLIKFDGSSAYVVGDYALQNLLLNQQLSLLLSNKMKDYYMRDSLVQYL